MAQPSPQAPLPVAAVLFDLDGTLLDTVADLHAAACAMMADFGRPAPSEEAVRLYVGRGVANLVKRLLAGSLVVGDEPAPSDALASFRQYYKRENGRQAVCYPGVLAGLERLKALGIPMGVVTNKPEAATLQLLAAKDMTSYFDVIVGGGSLPRLKPDAMPIVWACGRLGVSPADALFIGDSANDYLAAQAAGSRVFLLPYGYNEGRGVQDFDSDVIVPTVEFAAQCLCRKDSTGTE